MPSSEIKAGAEAAAPGPTRDEAAPPMDRGIGFALRESITNNFWSLLRRELTLDAIGQSANDPKFPDEAARIYVPHGDNEAFDYYSQDSALSVERLLPKENFTDDYLFDVAHRPGLLSLAFENGQPLPYYVPGGRFNEFYGWDSYFIARGLIEDGLWDDAAIIATQFAFEITEYGRIMNANRAYYLGRSQPPFLTDLAWRLQPRYPEKFPDWIHAAIVEYRDVWTSPQRYDETTGLSRYNASGRGIPPETEPGHFDDVLEPLAAQRGLSVAEFAQQYDSKQLESPEFDAFLRQDRAVRESGHDVTTRFFNICADLGTIDLSSLLYKYETDIARAVAQFPSDFANETAADWTARAERRRSAASMYHWDAENGRFVDYNLVTHAQHKPFTSPTTLWPLWSGLATQEQADAVVRQALTQVEFPGGLAATAEVPDAGRQWDYPAGWAPHQLLAWEGLEKYGHTGVAARLAHKWLGAVLTAFRHSEGGVYEKIDVTGVADPENVRAEYGNQGNKSTGFGWSNAAYAIGWDRYVKSKNGAPGAEYGA